MSEGTNPVSRRNVLKATGSAALVGAAGMASAGSGPEEFNVGYSAESGRQAAIDAADAVVRDFNSIDAVTVRGSEDRITGLESRGDVRYTEVNGTMEALGETLPWGIDRTDSDVAHANGETGNGADIAIIDTGIDDDHPDLQANIGKGKAYVNCDTSNGGCMFGIKPADNTCNYPWTDDNDHGTHCAGIADGVDNSKGVIGVSTEATLHAVKVLDKCGSGSYSDVAAGIEYTADQGWDVASMSLGGDKSSTVEDAVEYAASKGVTLVAAAGNSGPCTDCVGYPAAEPEVIAVSASNCSDNLADFSSQGPEVELIAPGKDIYSSIASNASYDTFSGTSMACPHVSGAAGQLAANGLNRSEIRSTLKDNAEDLGLGDNEQGSGLLDTAAALGYSSTDDGFGNGPNC